MKPAVNSQLWNALHKEVAYFAIPGEHFAAVLTWCEDWIDQELDSVEVAEARGHAALSIAKDAIRAYRRER